MRHSATLGGACAPAGKRVGLTRHVLSHFFAVALSLGTLAGSLDAIGLTTGRPAGAVAASVVKDTLHCWAETDKLTEGATETVTYVATSTPHPLLFLALTFPINVDQMARLSAPVQKSP